MAINTDLPVSSTSIGHLVAHEAYPGHHTEHSRKEVGLVRRAGHLEETIFLVGTPQCVVAEGLADLGIEVLLGDRRHAIVREHLSRHGVTFDVEAVEAVAEFGEMSAPGCAATSACCSTRTVSASTTWSPMPSDGCSSTVPRADEGRRVPDRPHVAGVHLLLHRRPAAVPRVLG